MNSIQQIGISQPLCLSKNHDSSFSKWELFPGFIELIFSNLNLSEYVNLRLVNKISNSVGSSKIVYTCLFNNKQLPFFKQRTAFFNRKKELIEKEITRIDIHYFFYPSSFQNISFDDFPKLRKFTISQDTSVENITKIFKLLPDQISSLTTLSNVPILGIKEIVKFHSLESLSIQCGSMTERELEDGMITLQKFSKLKVLELFYCSKLTDFAVGNFPLTVTTLLMSGAEKISDSGLISLSDNVTKLSLILCPRITDIGLGYLRPQITSLTLKTYCHNNQLTMKGIKGLCQLKLLEVRNYKIKDKEISLFPKGLTGLTIDRPIGLTQKGIEKLKLSNQKCQIKVIPIKEEKFLSKRSDADNCLIA